MTNGLGGLEWCSPRGLLGPLQGHCLGRDGLVQDSWECFQPSDPRVAQALSSLFVYVPAEIEISYKPRITKLKKKNNHHHLGVRYLNA